MVGELYGFSVEGEALDGSVFGRDLEEELGGVDAQLDRDGLDEGDEEAEDLLVVKVEIRLQDRVEVPLAEEEVGACLTHDVLDYDAERLEDLLGYCTSSIRCLVGQDGGEVAHECVLSVLLQ